MPDRAAPFAAGIRVSKPVPPALFGAVRAGRVRTVSGFLVRSEQIAGLDAATTVRAMGLDWSYRDPATDRRVEPYREGDDPVVGLLDFALTEEMAPATLVPTGIDVLQRLDESHRHAVPFVGMSQARLPDGTLWPGTPFTGLGTCGAGEVLMGELFLLGNHALPADATFTVRR